MLAHEVPPEDLPDFVFTYVEHGHAMDFLVNLHGTSDDALRVHTNWRDTELALEQTIKYAQARRWLPRHYRLVLSLIHKGWSQRMISTVLGCTQGNASRTMQTALLLCKAALSLHHPSYYLDKIEGYIAYKNPPLHPRSKITQGRAERIVRTRATLEVFLGAHRPKQVAFNQITAARHSGLNQSTVSTIIKSFTAYLVKVHSDHTLRDYLAQGLVSRSPQGSEEIPFHAIQEHGFKSVIVKPECVQGARGYSLSKLRGTSTEELMQAREQRIEKAQRAYYRKAK